jgi:hypothetical protein
MGTRSSSFGDPVVLLAGGLAVHRLTGLLVDDEITRPLRERVEQLGDRAAYLARCPRCVSVWVAVAWAGLVAASPRTARVAGAALAWSAVSGLLSSLE